MAMPVETIARPLQKEPLLSPRDYSDYAKQAYPYFENDSQDDFGNTILTGPFTDWKEDAAACLSNSHFAVAAVHIADMVVLVVDIVVVGVFVWVVMVPDKAPSAVNGAQHVEPAPESALTFKNDDGMVPMEPAREEASSSQSCSTVGLLMCVFNQFLFLYVCCTSNLCGVLVDTRGLMDAAHPP